MSRATKWWIGGIAGFIAFMALWIWLCPYFWTNLWWSLRAGMFVLLPLILVLIVVGYLGVSAYSRFDEGDSYGGRATAAVLLGIVGLAGIVWWSSSYHAYLQAHTYASSTTVVQDKVPTFSQRAPFTVAQAQAKPDLGASQGTLEQTKYQPATNQFTSLVVRNSGAGFVGYESVLDQTIPLTGHGTGRTCDFATSADLRISGSSVLGFFNHDLGRAIAEQRRWVSFDNGDVYGYCAGNTPMVVVPLKAQQGLFVVTEVPAGVALYNGQTGEITFPTDLSAIPGASYPLSLAAKQRAATQGLGSYGDWWSGTSGWATDDDPLNASNNTELTLAAGSSSMYVTPLTPRGQSNSISALSTISTAARAGSVAPMTVHTLSVPWQSPTAIEQRVKADYQDIPNWQNLQLDELVPTDGAHFVVTIGTAQNILYRATGQGALPATSTQPVTCLDQVQGEKMVPLRCGTAANTGGNGLGTQYGPNPTTGTSVSPLGDLSKLTPQQLAALQQQIIQEINRRLGVK